MPWVLRIVFVLLGAAIALSFASIDLTLVVVMRDAGRPLWSVVVLGGLLSVVPPVVLGLLPPLRQVEATAAATLLGVEFPRGIPGPASTWDERGRSLTWFLAHLLAGLAAVGMVTGLIVLGTSAFLAPAILGTVAVVAGLGWLLGRFAVPLLGPSYAERLRQLEEETARLVERNRIARELHDSVGHALSLITLQAAAAGRVIGDDPGFAARALADIEETGRSAVADLDHMLGLLRQDGEAPRAPAPDLTALDTLVAATRTAGLRVTVERDGDLADIPSPVSREAYRILQEGLTNAMRYSTDRTAAVSLVRRDGRLAIRVSNPVRGPVRRPGGRGLDGVRERAEALDGTATAARDGDRWTMTVDLPAGVR